MMSAPARQPSGEAHAALRELCTVLQSSEAAPLLATRNILINVGCNDDVDALDAAIMDEVANAERLADGEAGD